MLSHLSACGDDRLASPNHLSYDSLTINTRHVIYLPTRWKEISEEWHFLTVMS
jgi:hypothetical protein